jgi:hypothetical protein
MNINDLCNSLTVRYRKTLIARDVSEEEEDEDIADNLEK